MLPDAIKAIYRQKHNGLSFEELYRCAYNMVLRKHGDMLYDGVKVRGHCCHSFHEHLLPAASVAWSEALSKELGFSDDNMLQHVKACYSMLQHVTA